MTRGGGNDRMDSRFRGNDKEERGNDKEGAGMTGWIPAFAGMTKRSGNDKEEQE